MSVQVNVIHGCNEKCTYCVVPNTRGIEQSRAPEAIRVSSGTCNALETLSGRKGSSKAICIFSCRRDSPWGGAGMDCNHCNDSATPA